jgi:ABC-2 type transport system ATP-binding protein
MTRSAAEAVIVTEDLGKTFGRTTALAALDLTIGAGEVFGYLGPNGAGKTTTLRLLMGMLRPSTGRAQVLGRDSWRDAVAVHRVVGYVPGEPCLYDKVTGRQHIEYIGALRRDADDRHALALAEQLDLDLHRAARALSKGNRQKLALVLA